MPAIDEAVTRILGAVETVAPKAWAAAVQLQRVDAITCLVQWTAAMGMAVVAFRLIRIGMRRADEEGAAILNVLSWILLGIVAFAFVLCSVGNISQLLNAETHAAAWLMNRAH